VIIHCDTVTLSHDSQEHTVIIHCDTVTLSHDSQEHTMIIHCDTVTHIFLLSDMDITFIVLNLSTCFLLHLG
jgi:hypothetical protein